ncbi:hypothetical protein SAMN02910317_03035 [Ruminococcaceae bacterium FB2012]|nr:hypothetical protein SAMN02910317_03035 [Ruminococcaceae bacterium FB2012]
MIRQMAFPNLFGTAFTGLCLSVCFDASKFLCILNILLQSKSDHTVIMFAAQFIGLIST